MSNFYPLEVVGCGCETQLEVGADLNYLKEHVKAYSQIPMCHYIIQLCMLHIYSYKRIHMNLFVPTTLTDPAFQMSF